MHPGVASRNPKRLIEPSCQTNQNMRIVLRHNVHPVRDSKRLQRRDRVKQALQQLAFCRWNDVHERQPAVVVGEVPVLCRQMRLQRLIHVPRMAAQLRHQRHDGFAHRGGVGQGVLVLLGRGRGHRRQINHRQHANVVQVLRGAGGHPPGLAVALLHNSPRNGSALLAVAVTTKQQLGVVAVVGFFAVHARGLHVAAVGALPLLPLVDGWQVWR